MTQQRLFDGTTPPDPRDDALDPSRARRLGCDHRGALRDTTSFYRNNRLVVAGICVECGARVERTASAPVRSDLDLDDAGGEIGDPYREHERYHEEHGA